MKQDIPRRRRWFPAGRALIGLILCVVCAVPACALEYAVDAPEGYLYGQPTSVETVFRETEPINTDRSKNVARIPPAFGSPTSNLPGSGEYLTPNLVPGAFSGGLATAISTGYSGSGYAGYVGSGSANTQYPGAGSVTGGSVSVSSGSGTSGGDGGAVWYPGVETFTWSCESSDTGWYGVSFTDVTDDLYYSGGYLGTLKISAIGVNAKIYEGTSNTQLAKGIGHFTDTSIWDGNACFAAHNRGTNAIFGQIHTLEIGDRITLTTKLGTRNYRVESVKKITETDESDTAGTWENRVTLFTCVRDQREYRWCVTAVETTG